ncbi:hypothetical protein E2C01_050717 [Portunus trituberculatus]|uniref:Uncharacterized protein n=1 Tax=Portunus trituberculatus TaxID=210409 RepID=A0A5B7G9Q4_PORTR|nr:hypothetical protein [Portunus trituberculatus]
MNKSPVKVPRAMARITCKLPPKLNQGGPALWPRRSCSNDNEQRGAGDQGRVSHAAWTFTASLCSAIMTSSGNGKKNICARVVVVGDTAPHANHAHVRPRWRPTGSSRRATGLTPSHLRPTRATPATPIIPPRLTCHASPPTLVTLSTQSATLV